MDEHAGSEPTADEEPRRGDEWAVEPGGIYRWKSLVIAERDAVLPAVCVKTGEEEDLVTRRIRVAWFHPILYFTILVHVLLFIVLVLFLSKRAEVTVSISRSALVRRRHGAVLASGLGLTSVASFVFAFTSSYGFLLLFLFVVTALTAYGVYARWVRFVYARRVGDLYVWLKGAPPALLARLPEAPKALRI